VVELDFSPVAAGWADLLRGALATVEVTAASLGLGCVLGDLLLLRWRPQFALRVASLMLVGASCQAAFIGSGFGDWAIAGLEVLAGICVTGTFTLWETSLQEHVPDRALSRVSSYDYLTSAGLIPLGNLTIGFVTAAIGLHHALFAMTVVGVTAAVAIASVPAGTAVDSALFSAAKASLDRAKALDARFAALLQDPTFYDTPRMLRQLYRSRFRLLRGFSGLWLIYDQRLGSMSITHH